VIEILKPLEDCPLAFKAS